MGWGDVNKKASSGAGRFLSFEGKSTVRLRVLDLEPYTTRTHKISQVIDGKEVFRSIPATENPDDNYILKMNGTRYPEAQQHSLRVWEYKNAADMTSLDGEIRILQGGPAIFKPLKELYDQNGALTEFDIVITKKGEKRDTEYTVSAAPRSRNLDVQPLIAQAQTEQGLQWENVFPPVTAADQQRMITEAKIDITYDPAAVLMANMTVEQAHATQFTFGKFKGKSVGEVAIIDDGYISSSAANVTSNDTLAAACRVHVNHTAQIGAREEPKQLPPTTALPATPSAPKPAPKAAPAKPAAAAKVAPATDPRHTALVNALTKSIESDPDVDYSQVVETIKQYGGGKTRLKDLNVQQLESLADAIGVTL